MKRMLSIVLLFVVFFCSVNLSAKIRKGVLHKKRVPTEEMLLITQLDLIGLYNATRDVSFVSYIGKDRLIHVDMALFERAAMDVSSGKWETVVPPLVKVFMNVLQTRMAYYCPEVSKDFNPNEDIIFDVYLGKSKFKSVYGGNLQPYTKEKKKKSVKEADPKQRGIVGTRIKNVTGAAVEGEDEE